MRVSSQCWKRAARLKFPDNYRGVRTLKVPVLVRDKIMALDGSKSEDEALKLAVKALQGAGLLKSKKDDDGATKPVKKEKEKEKEVPEALGAAMFLSNAQAEALAAQALADPTDKKALLKALSDGLTADIAMFGRMVAADPSLNVDACVQVAHAISTHAVHTEYDYFTAVDEMNREDESGAGHVNTAEFDSGVLYRYACVNAAGLFDRLGDETGKAVATFVRSFLMSMPTGKANSYANFTRPGYIRVCVRDEAPLSFAGAFEKPVKTVDGGFFDKSVEVLEAYAADMEAKYGDKPLLDLRFADGGLDGILAKLQADIEGTFGIGGGVA